MISAKLLAKLSEKWPIKVLSLAAAIIIAIFYRMNTLETRFFTVPLHIEYNDNLILVNSPASAVRISLRGESDGIQQILEDDIEAYIDLGRYTNEGTFKAPVQIRKKNSALGITPLEISVLPIEIIVELELAAKRTIPEEIHISEEIYIQEEAELVQIQDHAEIDDYDLNINTEKEETEE